jgi:hypothetical protein
VTEIRAKVSAALSILVLKETQKKVEIFLDRFHGQHEVIPSPSSLFVFNVFSQHQKSQDFKELSKRIQLFSVSFRSTPVCTFQSWLNSRRIFYCFPGALDSSNRSPFAAISGSLPAIPRTKQASKTGKLVLLTKKVCTKVGKFFGAGGLDFLKKSCNNWSL